MAADVGQDSNLPTKPTESSESNRLTRRAENFVRKLVALLVALSERLTTATRRGSARGRLTPGKTAFVQRFTGRLKTRRDRIRFGALACAFILALRMVAGGSTSSAQPPPPLEVPYSAFLTVIEKEPSRIDRVMMSSSRWDFTLSMPPDAVRPVFKAKTGKSRAAAQAGTEASTSKRASKAAAASAAAAAVEQSIVDAASTPIESVGGGQQWRCFTRPVVAPTNVMDQLQTSDIKFQAARRPRNGASMTIPFIYLGVMLAAYSRMFRGMAGSAGKRVSTANLPPNTGFTQVAGVDQAKTEVSEIVTMLKDPSRYVSMGARLPSGLLLVGPPGNGKTLLARAVAGEAGVPFFSCSGSDFVEMFVGRGAARVRRVFAQAKQAAPSILFIDELDAIGKARNQGFSIRDNAEAEQTLNQLLAAMDGLDTSNDGVIVIAATNRFNVLDEALTRPGRFDRVVKVSLPDEKGRKDILKVHTRNLKLTSEDTIDIVAQITAGSSGAELAALVNEAAIRAVRRGGTEIRTEDFVDAVRTFSDSRGSSDAMGQLLKTAIGSLGTPRPS